MSESIHESYILGFGNEMLHFAYVVGYVGSDDFVLYCLCGRVLVMYIMFIAIILKSYFGTFHIRGFESLFYIKQESF